MKRHRTSNWIRLIPMTTEKREPAVTPRNLYMGAEVKYKPDPTAERSVMTGFVKNRFFSHHDDEVYYTLENKSKGVEPRFVVATIWDLYPVK